MTADWVVQISSGVGPIEVREFVALLASELQARCRRAGLVVESVASSGEVGAPRSVQLVIRGPVSVALSGCVGTHVLVARSTRRGRRSRKRWFAGVSLHEHKPQLGELVGVRSDEVEITTARASGPGGQHVNTSDSAVRVRHKPTGITVRAASERSQQRNRRIALARLAEILGERQRAEHAARTGGRRRSHYQFARGSAVQTWHIDVRSATLRPA